MLAAQLHAPVLSVWDCLADDIYRDVSSQGSDQDIRHE